MSPFRSDDQCKIERLETENAELKKHVSELLEEIDTWKRGETDVLLYPFSDIGSAFDKCRLCKHSVSPKQTLETEKKTKAGWFGKIIPGHPQRFRRECERCYAVYYERTAIDEANLPKSK